jgi:alpha-tubulin suppressor-like RCC1 family protein
MSARSLVPEQIPSSYFNEMTVVSISCGEDHTAFLTSNGHVYTSGLNNYGQLGNNNQATSSCIPVQIWSQAPSIIDIGCCGFSTVLVSEGNEVYICGADFGFSKEGEFTGDLLTSLSTSPIKVSLPLILSPFNYKMSVSCGRYHVMLLCSGNLLNSIIINACSNYVR